MFTIYSLHKEHLFESYPFRKWQKIKNKTVKERKKGKDNFRRVLRWSTRRFNSKQDGERKSRSSRSILKGHFIARVHLIF